MSELQHGIKARLANNSVYHLKQIRIIMTRELLTEVLEFFHVGDKGARCLCVVGALRDNMAVRMDGTCAAYIGAEIVLADAIDTDDKGLILDGTSRKQSFPGEHTLLRPIGHTNHDVVRLCIGITSPDGESEVIANEQ